MAKLSPSTRAFFDKELALDLTDDFQERGFPHLRVRLVRGALVVESGPAKGATAHARFSRETVHLWRLEMPARGGRWDPTPYRDLIDKLVTALIDEFPWTLAQLDMKPLRTFGPEY